jgi:hypothetical protein
MGDEGDAGDAEGEEEDEEEEEEEEDDDEYGFASVKGDPLAVADLDAFETMSAKFSGNLLLSSFLLALLVTFHLVAEFAVSRPHKRWLHAKVLHHSVFHPHLAMPHFFGHHHVIQTRAAR